MSLSGIYQLLLRGLEGTSDPNTLPSISREAPSDELKRRTGQDFGHDAERWRDYIRFHRDRLGVATFERLRAGWLVLADSPSLGRTAGLELQPE
jgi:hypothetical protein